MSFYLMWHISRGSLTRPLTRDDVISVLLWNTSPHLWKTIKTCFCFFYSQKQQTNFNWDFLKTTINEKETFFALEFLHIFHRMMVRSDDVWSSSCWSIVCARTRTRSIFSSRDKYERVHNHKPSVDPSVHFQTLWVCLQTDTWIVSRWKSQPD